ncbi:MAG: hypothetical protein NUV57_06610, partial [archaeon]|nr:hypothetical protein [archaeon]
MPRIERIKVKHELRKPQVIRKYNLSYFKLNKGDFSPGFLAKSAKEQATLLAKQEERTKQTLSKLKKMLTTVESVWRTSSSTKAPIKFTRAQLFALDDESQKMYEGMVTGADFIFSKKYNQRIGFSRGSVAQTDFQRDFHDAVKF